MKNHCSMFPTPMYMISKLLKFYQKGEKEPKPAENGEKDENLSDEELKKAAAVALAAAAVKAKHLATQEERKIRSLVAVLVDFQLKKMDLKMKQLDELETMLEKERETIENQRRQVCTVLIVLKIN